MRYKKLSNLDKMASPIVTGTFMGQMIEGEDASEILDQILNAGINFFDTAKAYASCEISLGKWLEKGDNREKAIVLTKGCHHDLDPYKKRVTPECFREDIVSSLERLRTDYIDIYLLHRDDPEVPVGPLMEVFDEYHRKGIIKVCGVSNWTVERIEEANQYAKEHGLVQLTVSEPNYSLCEQMGDPWGHGCLTITGKAEEHSRKWYMENQMPVLSYSSLGRGFLSGLVKSDDPDGAMGLLDEAGIKGYCYPENFKRLERVEQLAKEKNVTVSQIALAWIMNQKLDAYPIVTCDSPEHIQNTLGALEVRLTEHEVNWLDLRED